MLYVKQRWWYSMCYRVLYICLLYDAIRLLYIRCYTMLYGVIDLLNNFCYMMGQLRNASFEARQFWLLFRRATGSEPFPIGTFEKGLACWQKGRHRRAECNRNFGEPSGSGKEIITDPPIVVARGLTATVADAKIWQAHGLGEICLFLIWED